MAQDPLMKRAAQVVERNPIGMMMTVDEDGAPHGRWMGVTTRHGLSSLLSMSARDSRKVAHLRANPAVSWVFTSPDFADVVSLSGRAIVHDGPMMVRDAWDRLCTTGRMYGAGPLSDDEHLEMVVVETVVERVELSSAELDLPTPREVPLSRAG